MTQKKSPTTITSENHAKKTHERLVEQLADLRRWLWDEHRNWLPDDPHAPPETRHKAEAYGYYLTWFTRVDNAIAILDSAAKDFLMPSDDARREAFQQEIDDLKKQVKG